MVELWLALLIDVVLPLVIQHRLRRTHGLTSLGTEGSASGHHSAAAEGGRSRDGLNKARVDGEMTKKLPPHVANMASTFESALAWEVDAHRPGDTGAGARVLCRCAAGRALGRRGGWWRLGFGLE